MIVLFNPWSTPSPKKPLPMSLLAIGSMLEGRYDYCIVDGNVEAEGEVVGSVSGGCVEGAVVTEALSVLAGERQPGVVTFGYSDDEAFAVGLTCGGTIRLYIEELDW